jgi:hypothetical protein
MCEESSHNHHSEQSCVVINFSFTLGYLSLHPPSTPLDKPAKCRLKSKHIPNDWKKMEGLRKMERG